MDFKEYRKEYKIQLLLLSDQCIGYLITKNWVQKKIYWGESILTPQEAIDIAQNNIDELLLEDIHKYGIQLTLNL